MVGYANQAQYEQNSRARVMLIDSRGSSITNDHRAGDYSQWITDRLVMMDHDTGGFDLK